MTMALLGRMLVFAGVVLALALAVGACGDDSNAGEAAAAPKGQPKRVLVVSETRGYHHESIPDAQAALRRLGAADSRYDVKVLSSASQLTPARLANADAVVFANTTGTLVMTEAQRDGLLRFVRNGGGF